MERLTIIQKTLLGVALLCAHAILFAQAPTVALIGDVQNKGLIEFFREDNKEESIALLQQLSREDVQAVIFLGDLTFWGISIEEWKFFDELIRPLRENGDSLYLVLGNHEYFTDDSLTLRNVRSRFPWFTSTWYSRVIDSVGYVFLNTNTSDLGQVEMRQQYGWYLRTVRSMEADSAVRFVVVCGHHPPFTNSRTVEPEETLEKYFVKEFLKLKKSSYWFSGHCHSYERFVVEGKQFVVSGGGGGPRQKLHVGDDATFRDEYAGDRIRDFHYCLLQRTGNKLEMQMVPLKATAPVHPDSATVKGR